MAIHSHLRSFWWKSLFWMASIISAIDTLSSIKSGRFLMCWGHNMSLYIWYGPCCSYQDYYFACRGMMGADLPFEVLWLFVSQPPIIILVTSKEVASLHSRCPQVLVRLYSLGGSLWPPSSNELYSSIFIWLLVSSSNFTNVLGCCNPRAYQNAPSYSPWVRASYATTGSKSWTSNISLLKWVMNFLNDSPSYCLIFNRAWELLRGFWMLVNCEINILLNSMNEGIMPTGRHVNHLKANFFRVVMNKWHFCASLISIKDTITSKYAMWLVGFIFPLYTS